MEETETFPITILLKEYLFASATFLQLPELLEEHLNDIEASTSRATTSSLKPQDMKMDLYLSPNPTFEKYQITNCGKGTTSFIEIISSPHEKMLYTSANKKRCSVTKAIQRSTNSRKELFCNICEEEYEDNRIQVMTKMQTWVHDI
ncbi:hypothetical protein AVEN_58199-1 [Araneus ventricosus]|uniref:Uncharacterized protein n=1 Tax=Araneus ventricosus TaxID=182803 RepID=A0A4Y2RMX3_ARAVE|nr:hypothetical protein AVEN_58199-1 [Araneus ventricosus]